MNAAQGARSRLAVIAMLGAVSALRAQEAEAVRQSEEPLETLAGSSLSGYIDTSAIWMLGKGTILYGRSFDGGGNTQENKQDGFNLNVAKIQLEKQPAVGDWSCGYVASLLFGPDANTIGTTSIGALANDVAIREAYVSLRAPLGNGLMLKLGVFNAPIGYETFEAGANPNYSRAFAYPLEPTDFTGLQASYDFNDSITAIAGIADRGDINSINSRSGLASVKSYFCELTITAPKSAGFLEGATLSGTLLDSGITSRSFDKMNRAGDRNLINYYVGATLPTPVSGFSIGAALDYRANALFDGSYENAGDLYVIYQAARKLQLASRCEYASGSAGAFSVVPTYPHRNVRLFGETITASYSLWANTITRLEFRWDRSLTGQTLFGTGSERNALSVALNVIYNF
jgi:hypothetical protein